MLDAHNKGDALLAARYRAVAVTLLAIALAVVCMQAAKAGEPAELKSLVVLPFEILDTSGEVGPADRHDAVLGRLTALVRNEIASRQLYRVESQSRTDLAVAAVNPSTFLRNCNGCEIEIAKGLRADCVLIGWIYKMSTLILALHIDVKDVTTSKTIYARVFDFRGDNEEAYAHAVKVLVRSLMDELPVRSKATEKDR